MNILELQSVHKYYGPNHVVKDLNLQIREGEFLTVLGPSGCGKTTTLRMIGGFELPSSGQIILRNQDISQLPPYSRNVNTVFQNYALFPNMSVRQNVAFGLQQQKKDARFIRQRVDEMLDMVQMKSFENRKPQELSGGQQQRVAIARAVACDPDILLLDEPLGALDLKLRKQMQTELKNLHSALGKTFIYVTHDQEEALTMSDRIAVMHAGVLEQVSDASTLYYQPATRFVAEFIGEANILSGAITNPGVFQIGDLKLPAPASAQQQGAASLFIRPENIQMVADGDAGFVRGTVRDIVFVGSHRKYLIQLGESNELTVHEATTQPPHVQTGQMVWLKWVLDQTQVYYA